LQSIDPSIIGKVILRRQPLPAPRRNRIIYHIRPQWIRKIFSADLSLFAACFPVIWHERFRGATYMNTKSIITYRNLARFALLSALSLVTTLAHGQTAVEPATVTIAELDGSWSAAIVGNTGCGFTSQYVTFTLNSAGTGPAVLTQNSASANPGCGPSSTDQTFTINSLNANGTGTASFSCGPACGWTFNIQVAPSRQIFNMVDVVNDDNYLAGTAIRQ
jgi:hypothetical protein